MPELRYPGVLAAVRKGEKSLWEIGDALIEAIGVPSRTSAHDKSQKKLAPISAELKVNGYEYGVRYLAELRLMAHKFPHTARVASVSWRSHLEAGSPELLSVIIKGAPEGQPITSRYVDRAKKGLYAEEDQAQKRAYAAARQAQNEAEAEREAARKAKQQAKDKAERQRAEREEREAKERVAKAKEKAKEARPSPAKRAAAQAEDVPLALVKGQFDANVQEVKSLARKMRRDIEPYVDHLSKAFVEGSVEELLQVAEAFRKLADLLRKNQATERGHLHAVA